VASLSCLINLGLNSILSNTRTAISTIILFDFPLYILDHPFIFSLSHSLDFRYVSCTQYKAGFHFEHHSEDFFLSIGELKPFTFINVNYTFGLNSLTLFYLLCFPYLVYLFLCMVCSLIFLFLCYLGHFGTLF